MAYLKWLAPITLLYLMLTGNFEPANWVLGFLIALGVVGLVLPKPSPIQWSQLPRSLWAAIYFIGLLMWDLFASGIQVARMVINPNLTLNHGIVAIPDATEEDWVTTASAEAITLTPGELVVEIGYYGTLYTHTLDVTKTLTHSLDEQVKRAKQLERITE